MSNPASLKPFKKGADPRRNITGANRGKKWLTTMLTEALQRMGEGNREPYDALLIKRVLKKGIVDGDMRAIEHIWDRAEGPIRQIDERIPQNVQINIFRGEQIKRIAGRVLDGNATSAESSGGLLDSDEQGLHT